MSAGIIGLAIQRLRSRAGLTLLSLLGVVLAVGMVTSIPVFAQAVSFAMLRNELEELEHITRRAPFAIRFYYIASREKPLSLEDIYKTESLIKQELDRYLGLPIKRMVAGVETFSVPLRAVSPNSPYGQGADSELLQVTLSILPDAAEQIVISDGEPYAEVVRDGRAGVWVHDMLGDEMGLHVGEQYNLWLPATGRSIPIFVAGFWHAREYPNDYWYDNPAGTRRKSFLMTPAVFASHVSPLLPEQTGFASWYLIFDEKRLAVDRADAIANGMEKAANALRTIMPGLTMDYSPLQPVRNYIQRKQILSVLLVGFSLPALSLLLYFMALVSLAAVAFQTEETAILTSRGASRGFILGISVVETLILVAIGAPLGIALSVWLAELMGDTLSFLTFVDRPPIPVALAGLDMRLTLAALLALALARFIPTWQASGSSIVGHLRERSRQTSNGLLLRLIPVLALLTASLHTYQRLRQRGTLAIIGVEPSGDPFRDPALLLAPSLFVVGACLLLAHLFPLVISPLAGVTRRLPWFPGYMAMHQLARQSGQYANALFLALMCLSLGAFYSSLALSLDTWLGDHAYYQTGADFTFRQGVRLLVTAGGESGSGALVEREGGWLLPATDYEQVPGVVTATRVGEYSATARQSGAQWARGRFVGIDRISFPQVAFFRDDFSDVALADLLNRLGMFNDGLLVPREFLVKNNLQEGQQLDLEIQVDISRKQIPFRIVGVFDYFPTFYAKKEQVFVGNLEYLFEQTGGLYPHSIWMRTDETADTTMIRERIREMGVEIAGFNDTRANIMKDEDRVERVGLFGVLTIGFVAGSVLSVIGLLLYTFASLRERIGQLSVLRAIGAQGGDVLLLVGVEYSGIVAYGVCGGAAVGVLASHLFVPFFQFSGSPELALPPFLLQIAWGKTAAIAVVFAVSLILSQLIILHRLTRQNMFESLRMGQHQ